MEPTASEGGTEIAAEIAALGGPVEGGHRGVVTPRPSATVMVLRDSAAGPEVLLLQRVKRSGDRHSGAYVFPGGTLDPDDSTLEAWCDGLSDAQASSRLNVETGGLAYYVAAIRECFEEAAVLLARDRAGQPFALDRIPTGELAALRSSVREGVISMRDVCERLGARLAVDWLAYHSHWVTPAGFPKRFDARFFLALLPPGQAAAVQSEETHAHRWMRPPDALGIQHDQPLPFPTRRSLEDIARHGTSAVCLQTARDRPRVPRILPMLGHGARGLRPVHPSEPSYAEIARIDPNGEGLASCLLQPDVAVRLSPCVIRVTAVKPGTANEPGINTYVVGDPVVNRWVVIDPGPEDTAHIEAVIAAAPGPIHCILVTSGHADQSAGAAALGLRTDAPVASMAVNDTGDATASSTPGRLLADHEAVAISDAVKLTALRPPGLPIGRACYRLDAERTLFTGSSIEQRLTMPDASDVASALGNLRNEDLDWLAPGRGFLINLDRVDDA